MLWCEARNNTAWRRRVDPRLAMFENPPDDELRLLVLALAAHQGRPLAFGARRPEVFGVSLPRQADHGVGGIEDGLRAAVILLQGQDVALRIMLGKIENVADRGGAEGVDRLGVVADNRQSLPAGQSR